MLKEYDPIDLAVRAYAAVLQESSSTITYPNQDTAVFVVCSDRIYMMMPEGKDILVGRHHHSNIMQPELDLSAYDAEDAGMSRLHAAVKHENNGWWLLDLNSSNGTWINGEQLTPFVPCQLNKTNHVFLGKLELAIILPESRHTSLVA